VAAPTLPSKLELARLLDGLQQRICSTAYANLEPGFRAARNGRFDDPNGVFKTLYCAPCFGTCYAETLLRSRLNVATGRFEVPQKEHDSRSLSMLLVDFPRLKMVDMLGAGLQAMGLDNAVTMGAYSETQALARALYEHPDAPDGIVYLSRYAVGQQPAVVLFDRAIPHVRKLPGLDPLPLNTIPEVFHSFSQDRAIAFV